MSAGKCIWVRAVLCLLCREDAQAALDLYLRHIHWQPQRMSYDDLVERHLADIMRSMHSMDGAADGSSSSGGGGQAGG